LTWFVIAVFMLKTSVGVAFQVLPLIVFVSAIMGILVYLGVIQLVIKISARILTLKIPGLEAFTCSMLIFMGIETITGVRDYIKNMNESRIFTIMTTIDLRKFAVTTYDIPVGDQGFSCLFFDHHDDRGYCQPVDLSVKVVWSRNY
jgi:hypothetical protein